MIYGYGRVSTKGQAKDGNSLEVQELLLKNNGSEKIYIDVFTGKVNDRPEFNKLIKILKEGDTLICTKLDRVARSLIQGSDLVTELINKGIRINILNIGVMDNSPSSKLIRNIFFAFAEFERDMIIERTREGKAVAKEKEGFREGRPKKFKRKQIEHALQLKIDNGYSYRQVEELTGISVSTLKRAKREVDLKNIEK